MDIQSPIRKSDLRFFSRWHFPEGTTLGSKALWGNKGQGKGKPTVQRQFEGKEIHWGTDFAFFIRKITGTIATLSAGIPVFPIAPGTVVNIGDPIAIRHDNFPSNCQISHSLYLHVGIRSGRHLQVGTAVGLNNLLSRITPVPMKLFSPHLHLCVLRDMTDQDIKDLCKGGRLREAANELFAAGKLLDPLQISHFG